MVVEKGLAKNTVVSYERDLKKLCKVFAKCRTSEKLSRSDTLAHC